jgi:threonine dehydrogenase-like Zn-dependent dehydrogenase
VQAVLVTQPGSLAFVEQAESPLGPCDVRIRVKLSGLSSRSEIERYQRNYAGKPEAIGYNLVGVVEETGPEVTRVAVGDRVYTGSGHADVALVDESRAIKIPDGVDDESACFAYLPTLGTHALRLAGYQPGEFVAIVGQGIIGQTAGLVVRMFGARTIAVDVSNERLALAKRLGAHLTINPSTENAREKIAEFCGTAGLDIAIDTASTWRSYAQSLDLIRKRGRVVLLGIIRDRPTEADIDAYFDAHRRNFHDKEAVVVGASNDAHDPTGASGARFTYARNIEEILFHVADGSLNLKQLITHRYPISEIESVYQLLLSGGGQDHLGVVFNWPQ